MRALAVLLLFLPALSAAVSNLRVAGTTATQAILSWTAPDAGVCLVDVVSTEPVTAKSFSATGNGATVTVTLASHGRMAGQGVYLTGSPWTGWQTVVTVVDANTFTFAGTAAGAGTGSLYLPVDDVHAGLFAGVNSDSRVSGVVSGRNRLLVIGKRAAEIASDGRYHSRALQAYTQHFYRIRCGDEATTGTFTTRNIPLGSTYNDPLPADPNSPGTYAWPEFSPTDRNTTVIDPQTGMLIKPILFAGDVYVQPYGLTFDTARNQGSGLCTDGAWTNPCAAVNGADGNTNASVGNSNAWLVIRPNKLAWNSYSWDPVDTMAPELDSMRLDIKGSGTSSTDTLRQIDLCLSTDGGQTCATAIQSGIQLGQDAGNPPAGTIVRTGPWTPGIVDPGFWQATPRITRPNIYTRTGNVTISGSTVNWSAGNYFNAEILKPGAPVRLSTVSTTDACSNGAEFTIASVASGTQLTLGSAPGTAYTYYCAPNFALMIRRSNPDAASRINIENVTADVVFSSPGHFAANGAKKIFGRNKFFSGYLGFLQMGGMGSTLIWVNPDTGETRALGLNRMNAKTTGPDRWDYSTCAGDTAVIDDTKTDNLTWYCVAIDKATSKTIVLRGRYLGPATGAQVNSNSTGIGTGCTEPDQWTISCSNVLIQNLTPASLGAAVPDQVAAFDPLYDASKCKNWSPNASPNGRLTINCTYAGQETLGWTAILDPGDGNPTHAGQTGGPRVLSAMNTWSSPGARWGVWHTTTDTGDMDWQSVAINIASGGSTLGGGPWVVQTTSPITGAPFDDCALYGNPSGVSGPQCSQWTITKLDANGNPDPVNGSPEPYDPTPGPGETKAPGFLQSAQPGDILCVGGTTLSNTCYPNSGYELVKLLAKTDNLWVVQRKLTTAPLNTYPSSATKYLYMTVNNLRIPQPLSYTSAGGGVVWNYLTDPHGLAAQRDPYNYGDHAFIKPGMNTQVRNGCWGNLPCYSTRYGTYPDLFSIPDSIFSARTAPFAGIYGHSDVDGSSVESHAGPPPVNGSRAQSKNYYDGRPVIKINNLTWTKVDGTQQVYRFNAGPVSDPDNIGSGVSAFSRKAIATHAACGPHTLQDLSGRVSTFGDGAAARYTYCVPRANGECYPGSVPGDVYVNCPLIDHPTCYGQTASVEDTGGPVNDICVGNQHSYANAVLEAAVPRTDRIGQYARILSTLSGKNKLNNPYFSSAALPDGSWVIWKWWRVGDWRSYDVMGKLPPFPAVDSANRGDFATVKLTVGAVPPGTQTATVQFGYAENGTPGDFRCTTRQEGCVKGAQPGDDYGFAGENVTGAACAAGCTIGVPAIPQRVLYYRYQYRDAANAVIATSAMQALAVP